MRNALALFVFCVTLAACGPATVTVGPVYPDPGYVYVYPDGGCWADDIWHPQCPWIVGSHPGYYYRHQSHYYWQPRTTWRDRHRPPPRVRDHRPSPRDHRVPPPRTRDHRRRHR